MGWTLKYPEAGKLIAAYQHYNQPIPDALIPPELNDIEIFYWEAFWELGTDRQMGMMSEGPIPWSSLVHFSNAHKWVDFDFLSSIIRELDKIYMSRKSEEMKKNKVGL